MGVEGGTPASVTGGAGAGGVKGFTGGVGSVRVGMRVLELAAGAGILAAFVM